MSVREVLNRYPAITTVATLAAISVAVAFIVCSQWPGNAPKAPTKAFFTIDDGKTWFADDVRKLTPFEKDGKQAVRAHVFKCSGEAPYVAYMDRLVPEARMEVERLSSKAVKNAGDISQMQSITQTGLEYKRPGDEKWMKMSDDYLAFGQMLSIRCKDANETPTPLDPERDK